MNQKNILKILLAIAFLLCLLKMPYWYYQLIRVVAMVGFIYFAYLDSKEKIKITPILFVLSAIIINPIIKIPFHKNDWQIIDIIFAVILILSLFWKGKHNSNLIEETKLKNRIISEEKYKQANDRVKKFFEDGGEK